MTRSMDYRIARPHRGKGLYEFGARTIGRLVGDSGLTLPGTNYCGPYNSISEEYQRTHPPKNRIDQICLDHDLDYAEAQKVQGTPQYAEKIRAADQKMVDRIDAISDKSLGERILGGIAGTAIRGKMVADRITGNGAPELTLPPIPPKKKPGAVIIARLVHTKGMKLEKTLK